MMNLTLTSQSLSALSLSCLLLSSQTVLADAAKVEEGFNATYTMAGISFTVSSANNSA